MKSVIFPQAPVNYRVLRFYDDHHQLESSAVAPSDKAISKDEVLLQSTPMHLCEGAEVEQPHDHHQCKGKHHEETSPKFEEYLVSESRLDSTLKEQLLKTPEWNRWPGSEVLQLVDQGKSSNRIDLTIVGDGYTQEEKERFFKDARRLTKDLFEGQTFASYLPLFNVHAVFVPSKESGLTDGSDRRDTALGLYRSPAGSKRGVIPGNRRRIESALSLAQDTDYPILVANDDFYGGLGGRYAVTTRSHNSGTMVLRHELGHNFGSVGEEYDGGQVYRGANHSRTGDVPWKRWVDGALKVEKSKILATSYPWENLANGPIKVPFKVPVGQNGEPWQMAIDVSSVGWSSEKEVELLIDGKPQKFEGVYTEDRSFFRLKNAQLSEGKHTLEVRQKIDDGDNVVAAIRINAFPQDYDFTRDKVGAFPTFDANGRHRGYRPTHESCLMRDMRHTEFCSVDKENMWHQFLRRVDLIDSLDSTPAKEGEGAKIRLKTPALEGLQVRWYQRLGSRKEVELKELRGQKEIDVSALEEGNYYCRVDFSTDEVRSYNEDFTSQRDFSIRSND